MSEAAADLDIIYAQSTITVAGREVTLRELTVAQSLGVHQALAPLLAELQPHYGSAAGVDSEFMVATLAGHPDLAFRLLSLSTGLPAAWLAALPSSDGYLLLLHFVGLHAPFFETRLALAHQAARARALTTPILAPSSGASSATGTAQTH